MPHRAGLFVIVDGAGIIRAFGPPRADGSPRLDPSCIGVSLFETFPDLPREPVAEGIAASLWNGRLGPRQVCLDPSDPLGVTVEVSAVDGMGQVLVRWVDAHGLDTLASALTADLSEEQTVDAVAHFLAARLAPARILCLFQGEGGEELVRLAHAGPWPAPPPARLESGALGRLAVSGGLIGG